MSIEGNVLSNSFANATAENMYQNSLASRNDLPLVEDGSVVELQEVLNANTIQNTQNVQSIRQISPGDEILNTMQKVSDIQGGSVQALADAAKNIEARGQLTMSGVLEMQTKLMEFQLKQELISKATGSISQGMQTLFKNQ